MQRTRNQRYRDLSRGSNRESSQDSAAAKDRNPAGQRRALNVTSAASSKFPKSRHLLKHADFQRVYQNGRRQFTGNMTIFFLRRSGGPETIGTGNTPRVGFTVGKVLGGAVERNRIRRRMREAVRLSGQACDGPIDVVFNPRKSVGNVPFAELVSEVTRALRLAAQRARTGEQK